MEVEPLRQAFLSDLARDRHDDGVALKRWALAFTCVAVPALYAAGGGYATSGSILGLWAAVIGGVLRRLRTADRRATSFGVIARAATTLKEMTTLAKEYKKPEGGEVGQALAARLRQRRSV